MNSEALTLNELRELDKERVWVEGGDWNCWALVNAPPFGAIVLSYADMMAEWQYLERNGVRCYREKPLTLRDPGGECVRKLEDMMKHNQIWGPLSEAEKGESMTEKANRHRELCLKLNALYAKKNHDYGDSFGQTFKAWGPVAAGVRMADKLNRFVALSKQAAEVDDESVADTLMDLANYAVMTVLEMEGEE